jgi:hypothetical protein
LNLGLDTPKELEDLLIHFKQQERSIVTVQFRDPQDRKKVSHSKHYIIEVLEWTTVIDMDSDLKWMKTILAKGQGLDRVSPCDRFSVSYSVQATSTLREDKLELTNMDDPRLPKLIKKVLYNMKGGEACEIRVKAQHAIEVDPESLSALELEADQMLAMKVQVEGIVKVHDLFSNGAVLAYFLQPPQNHCKPQKHSRVQFSLHLRDDPSRSIEIDAYLDELRISKMLRKVVLRMVEESRMQVECLESGCCSGLEKELVEGRQGPLVLVVHLGKIVTGQSYTFSVEEKVKEIERTKVIAVQLLEQGKFKKAEKIFLRAAGFFEYEKDNSEQVEELVVSAMLNASLCQLKEGRFQGLLDSCDKILLRQKDCRKAVLRRILALEKLQEYDRCLEELEAHRGQPGYELEEDLARVRALRARLEQKERRVFGRMFG